MRSKMGKSVASPQTAPVATFESLTRRAEVAFNVTNAQTVTAGEKVLKKIRGILNKISPEKYEVLFEELWKELSVDGQVDVMGMVEQVIATVFDIALDQPKFSYLYADVCFHLCRKIQISKENDKEEGDGRQDSRQDSMTGDDGKPSATLKEFRRVLLNTCQARFEEGSKHQQTVIPADADDAERHRIEKSEMRYKARSLGNIKFIAELFKRSLLSERIMHIVIRILLLDTDHMDPRNIESIETLHEMLNVVGKKLDRLQAQSNMDMYFETLAGIAQTHPIKRIRFLILNMVELRKANWVSRQDMKQTVDEDVKRGPRSTSWVSNAPGEPPRVVARLPSNKEVVAKVDKDKEKDGFKLVGRKTSAWEKVPAPPQPSPHRSPASPEPAGLARAKAPTSPVTPASTALPPPEVPKPRPPPAPTDEQIAAKARGLLEEWAADPTNKDNALAVLREEIPSAAYPQFLMGMLLGAISQNKWEKERAELPALYGLYTEQALVQPEHLNAAFIGALQKAKRDEVWVDAPGLWKNIGAVLCACLAADLMGWEALVPMSEELANHEEHPTLPLDFFTGVLEAMKLESFEETFDAEKANGVVAALSKPGKKKNKAKKVTSVEELEAALVKMLTPQPS